MWEKGNLKKAEIISKKGEVCRLKLKAGKPKIISRQGGVQFKIIKNICEFKTRPG